MTETLESPTLAPLPGFFQRQPTAAEDARKSDRTRTFTGDGTQVLRVPGLVTLERVWVGETEIPLRELYRLPLNGSLTERASLPLARVTQSVDDDGTPILLRAVDSNDGVWQECPVFVQGEWAPDEGVKGRGR